MNNKELLEMPYEKLEKICHGKCESDLCPFSKDLWNCRIDGYCIQDTLKLKDTFIKDIEFDIKRHKVYIKVLEDTLAKLKEKIRRLENDR